MEEFDADGPDGDLNRVLALLNEEPLDLFALDKLIAFGPEERVSFLIVRLLYFYYTFRRLKAALPDVGLAGRFLPQMEKLLRRFRDRTDRTATYEALLDGLPADTLTALHRYMFHWLNSRLQHLFKLLEADSRGQADNVTWHVLRVDTVSATKFYDTLLHGRWVPDRTFSRAKNEGVCFGNTYEPVVKTLLEFHVMGGREPLAGGLGLLMDPTSGLLGASLDICFGLRKKEGSAVVAVGSGASIFEVKCRYKYLRPYGDEHVAEVLRRASADDPGPVRDAVVRFILSHPRPGVEYLAGEDDVPSGQEYLLSRDVAFRTKKRLRQGTLPDFLKPRFETLIRANDDAVSTVIVFDTRFVDYETGAVLSPRPGDAGAAAAADAADAAAPGEPTDDQLLLDLPYTTDEDCPGAGGGEAGGLSDEATPELTGKLCLYEKARFSAPVFVNPKHQYYFQTLVQHYVLSQYYIRDHPDPERIQSSDLPTASIVSAVLRQRGQHEIGHLVNVGGRSFDCDHIPLFIIITPVRFDPYFVRDAVNVVLNDWERRLSQKTGLRIWVPNAASEYLASAAPKAQTP